MSTKKIINYVIFATNQIPMVYNFAETKEEAENEKEKFVESIKENIKTYKIYMEKYDKKYWGERLNIEKESLTQINITSLEEYEELVKKHYLDNPIKEITEEKYEEMLNILPPKKWCSINNISMFCMCEMIYETYTDQYAHDKNTGKYWTKTVDITNKETWIHNYIKR